MIRRNRHGKSQVSGLYVHFLRIDFYKLFLNLLVLALLGLIVWSAVKLFLGEFLYSPLIGSIVFFVEIAAFVLLCRHTRANKWRPPSIVVTTLVIMAMLIIMAFAGVQPLTNYKNNLTNRIDTLWAEQKLKNEEKKIAEENRKAIEEAEMKSAGVENEYNFYKEYVTLFNGFRAANGQTPLTFDSTLNELANKRVVEISQPGTFSHEGIKQYNLGENIAMMAYSYSSASDLIELWASSPGHRSNMLSSSYHRTGFAKYEKYAVQIFD
ncbi:MAG TPA: CAP domain-containing protein [Dehalococcoidia bacterium]|jgi:uncharacterized protein YkwD